MLTSDRRVLQEICHSRCPKGFKDSEKRTQIGILFERVVASEHAEEDAAYGPDVRTERVVVGSQQELWRHIVLFCVQ